jgi:hypothetical protein
MFQHIERVVKEAIAGTLNMFAGVVGAVYANEFMHKYILNKPPFTIEKQEPPEIKERIKKPLSDELNEKQESDGSLSKKTASSVDNYALLDKNKKNVFKNFRYDYSNVAKVTANRVFSTVSDLPDMKVLTKSSMALTGFSVANVEGYHNKLKKTTYELLANTFIPTLFVSIASIFVENKKSSIKLPILLSTIIAGIYTGSKVANKLKNTVNERIDKIDMKRIVV